MDVGYFKTKEDERFFNSSIGLARYGGLARKALSHYLGDKYIPGEFRLDLEFFFRGMIQGWVELKVFDNIPYDWPVIDNFFRKVLHDAGYDISYDQSILDKGYHGVFRGDLPQFHA